MYNLGLPLGRSFLGVPPLLLDISTHCPCPRRDRLGSALVVDSLYFQKDE